MEMLKEERQNLILNLLRQNGKVVAAELSTRFSVSEDTVRRDLRELSAAGQMMRVHGGGLPHSPAGVSFTERLKQSPEAKAAIARAAVNLIREDMVVIFDGGTTNLLAARALPAELHATIVTNCPSIADALADHPNVRINLIGGQMLKSSRVTVGAPVVDALRAIHADLCLLGICSLHPGAGISLVDYEESFVKGAMITSSARVVALASIEKLGTVSPYVVAPITSLDTLITEKEVPDEQIAPYLEAGIQVEQV
jgi:DeoR/GlpR family transcriptional regulator of sugar metabolism